MRTETEKLPRLVLNNGASRRVVIFSSDLVIGIRSPEGPFQVIGETQGVFGKVWVGHGDGEEGLSDNGYLTVGVPVTVTYRPDIGRSEMTHDSECIVVPAEGDLAPMIRDICRGIFRPAIS